MSNASGGYEDRHPSTQHMMKMLRPNVNLKDDLKRLAEEFYKEATIMVNLLEDSPELTAGLRKLLEAKDCFVRAAVFQNDPNSNPVDYRDR